MSLWRKAPCVIAFWWVGIEYANALVIPPTEVIHISVAPHIVEADRTEKPPVCLSSQKHVVLGSAEMGCLEHRHASGDIAGNFVARENAFGGQVSQNIWGIFVWRRLLPVHLCFDAAQNRWAASIIPEAEHDPWWRPQGYHVLGGGGDRGWITSHLNKIMISNQTENPRGFQVGLGLRDGNLPIHNLTLPIADNNLSPS